MDDSTSQGDQMTDDENTTDLSGVDPEKVAGENADQIVTADELDDATAEDEPDTFDRAYVEKLRQENGKYRQRAQRADELAHRLHRALVESHGKLADPTDLPFDEEHLTDDGSRLREAIDDLLTRKPHLAKRQVTGDIGQGASTDTGTVDLMGILRGH